MPKLLGTSLIVSDHNNCKECDSDHLTNDKRCEVCDKTLCDSHVVIYQASPFTQVMYDNETVICKNCEQAAERHMRVVIQRAKELRQHQLQLHNHTIQLEKAWRERRGQI